MLNRLYVRQHAYYVRIAIQREVMYLAKKKQQVIMTMSGAVAELEPSLILERQKEGIAIARSKGVYKGGKQKLCGRTTENARKRHCHRQDRPSFQYHKTNRLRIFGVIKV